LTAAEAGAKMPGSDWAAEGGTEHRKTLASEFRAWLAGAERLLASAKLSERQDRASIQSESVHSTEAMNRKKVDLVTLVDLMSFLLTENPTLLDLS
jgi:hypothetical protein